MSGEDQSTRARNAAAVWDDYVDSAQQPGQPGWPGDEWANPRIWAANFEQMIAGQLPAEARKFVEIGGGSGKYSEMVLTTYPEAALINFDVSRRFLEVFERRMAAFGGRAQAVSILPNYKSALEHLEQIGWKGEVDAFFSIDAMVHVDLEMLLAYFLTAAETLRVGGKLIMTVADCTSDHGFRKLLADMPEFFPLFGAASSQFRWMCPQAVEHLLTRCGFGDIRFLDREAGSPLGGARDIHFVAALAERPAFQW